MFYFPAICCLGEPHWAKRPGNSRLAVRLLLTGILAAAGCGSAGPERSDHEPLRVTAAIEPIAFLVERVAGPYAQVEVLIPAGADAHTFQLSPRQMTELAKADLCFRVGLALEDRMLEKVRQTRPDFPVVDLAEGLARRPLSPEDHRHHHDHESGDSDSPAAKGILPQKEEHHEGGESAGLDPHLWLSPPLLKAEAQRIAHALSQHDPAHAAQYRQNLAQLEAELDVLHAWIGQQLAPYRGRTFLVFHPSFGYFADCYGLRQMAVQVEGKTPTPQELRRLIQQAQSEGTLIILVQPQFDHRAAQVAAEAVGARLVEINDLDRNVPETLKKLTRTLVEAFAAAQANQPETPPDAPSKVHPPNQPKVAPPSPAEAPVPFSASPQPFPQDKQDP